jgi:hypothetical protein
MNQSPIFVKTHELLLWLLPQTAKFPRQQRFALTQSVQQSAMRLLDRLVEAGMSRGAERVAHLSQADMELVKLKAYLRLCEGMNLLTPRQVEHVARFTLEIGKLLGAWLAQAKKSDAIVQAPSHPAVGID